MIDVYGGRGVLWSRFVAGEVCCGRHVWWVRCAAVEVCGDGVW